MCLSHYEIIIAELTRPDKVFTIRELEAQAEVDW